MICANTKRVSDTSHGNKITLTEREQTQTVSHLGYFNELVVVIVAVEEGFLPEYHPGQHASERPEVEGVVILEEVHQQL